MNAKSYMAWFRTAILACLAGAVAMLIVRTWHWPLVNDAAQLNYACFLMDHGMVPYRDLLEMNMPGAYAFNWTVMHTLGSGAVAWRVFDLLLASFAGTAVIAIAWPYDWMGGVVGAGLFLLYHGRDGAGQQGQRDLIIAVLLLVGYAFVFESVRRNKPWLTMLFGLCAGIAGTIKPTPFPFAILLLVAVSFRLHSRRLAWRRTALYGAAGMVLPVCAMVAFLWEEHALPAFGMVLREVLPYYADLGRRPAGYLLKWSMSPSILGLLVFAAAIAWKRRDWREWERAAVIGGMFFGVVSYFAQGKGFPYHRYPLLAFAMLWVGMELTSALRERGVVRVMGVTGMIFAAGILPFLYVAKASRVHWNEDLIASLQTDLNTLGGNRLSGHVQCLYTLPDCDTALYRMQLVQSTGLFYEFLIFGPQAAPTVQDTRQQFWRELMNNPPEVIIAGAELYPWGPDNFEKLKMWPQFRAYVQDNYRVYDQRAFRPGEQGPLDYRIYVAKNGSTIWSRRPSHGSRRSLPPKSEVRTGRVAQKSRCMRTEGTHTGPRSRL